MTINEQKFLLRSYIGKEFTHWTLIDIDFENDIIYEDRINNKK